MSDTEKYWFPAKRYGWGWGFPATWQGWIVLISFVALIAVSGFVFSPEIDSTQFYSAIIVLTALFVIICWRKGEPPRWRWGK